MLALQDTTTRQVATGSAWGLVLELGNAAHEAAQRSTGGPDLDQRVHRLLLRAAPLLPNWPAPIARKLYATAPAYTRHDGDLRALRAALPAGVELAVRPVPELGRSMVWEARTIDAATLAVLGSPRTAAGMNLAAAAAVLALLSDAVMTAWSDGD